MTSWLWGVCFTTVHHLIDVDLVAEIIKLQFFRIGFKNFARYIFKDICRFTIIKKKRRRKIYLCLSTLKLLLAGWFNKLLKFVELYHLDKRFCTYFWMRHAIVDSTVVEQWAHNPTIKGSNPRQNDSRKLKICKIIFFDKRLCTYP